MPSFQVILEKQADTLCASSVRTNRVEAIRIAEDKLPGFRRFVADTHPRAGMNVARLLQTGNVIDHRNGTERADVPAFIWIEGQRILAAQQSKTSRADFLKIISGQRKRKLRDERQNAVQLISAESIGGQTGPGSEAQTKGVF